MDPERARQIATNLEHVRARITAAEKRYGRAPGSVRLIAVSKTMPADDVRAALAAGQLDFGENYGQELRDKRAALADEPQPPRWHYIGSLQANKVKYVAGTTVLVHSLDDVRLCEALDRRVPEGVVQPCLVQVNVGGERQKAGVTPAALGELLDCFARTPRLRCVGLMTVPPYQEDPWASAPYFALLARLGADSARTPRTNVEMNELSMGMSHDFEVAIAHGATLVRVGTAVFGARPAPGTRASTSDHAERRE